LHCMLMGCCFAPWWFGPFPILCAWSLGELWPRCDASPPIMGRWLHPESNIDRAYSTSAVLVRGTVWWIVCTIRSTRLRKASIASIASSSKRASGILLKVSRLDIKDGCRLCKTFTLCVITLSYDNLIPSRLTDGISLRSLSIVFCMSESPRGPKAWLKMSFIFCLSLNPDRVWYRIHHAMVPTASFFAPLVLAPEPPSSMSPVIRVWKLLCTALKLRRSRISNSDRFCAS